MADLRPYQLATLEAIKTGYRNGVRRQVVVSATGTGKTVVFSNLPEHFDIGDKKMLVLVHTDELAEQARDKIAHWNPFFKVGIEMGEKVADPDCSIIVGSPQTLGRAGSVRIQKFKKEDFAVLICDECHHAAADSYKRVFDHFMQPKLLLVGFTATPNRSDGEGLNTVFEKIVYEFSMRDAIEQGWLSDIRGVKVTSNISLDRVSTRAGDFALNELEDTVNTPERNATIVRGYIEHAWPRKFIAFCVDIQHAKDLAAEFQRNSIPVEAIWGADPERKDKLKRHKAGQLLGLCNCAVLTEGYDDWSIQAIIMARPTKSQMLFIQCAGRGTRLEEGVDNLKDALRQGRKLAKVDCLLMDVVDNSSRHSLVTLPSLFGMNKDMDLRGKSVIGTLKKLEEQEKATPNVDLSRLTDIAQLQTYVESVNLFEVKFAEEVTQNSQLRWIKRIDGAYVLNLPGSKEERVIIKKNLLNQFEVSTNVKGNTTHEDGYTDLADAMRYAELVVSSQGREYMNMLKREWKSGNLPATMPQMRTLKRIFAKKGQVVPAGVTKSQANNIISNYYAHNLGAKY